MEESGLFLSSGSIPAVLPLFSPSARLDVASPCGSAEDEAGEPGGCGSKKPKTLSLGILCACSEIVSKWFSVMRSAIGRERSRQSKFREKHQLPKSSKIPYVAPSLTDSDKSILALAESVFRCLFGDAPTEYAKSKFEHAIETGDMRSFKIRLIVLKVRDSIRDPELKKDFEIGAEECISLAEESAGCKPDPSPRRLSKNEQERKKRLDAIRNERLKREKAQMELPLVWPKDANEDGLQDIEQKQDITKNEETHNAREENVNITDIEKKCDGVTVTNHHCYSNRYSNASVVRKAREYKSVDEILEDIDLGKIVPYESTDEILADVRAGVLGETDALMFTAALDSYLPDDQDETDVDEDIDDEVVDGDGDETEDGDDYEYEQQSRSCGTGFSYNPNGFAGCEGRYSESEADWDKDDDW